MGNLFDQSCLLNTLFCFRILHFMCINFFNSWTTKIFGCIVSVDHVPQLCCVSLSMLPFAELFSLRTSTYFARLSTEELCAYTNNERSIVGQRDLWNIDFVFHCFFVQSVLSNVYRSKEGFSTERRKCFSVTLLLAVVNRSDTLEYTC